MWALFLCVFTIIKLQIDRFAWQITIKKKMSEIALAVQTLEENEKKNQCRNSRTV